MPEYFVGKPYKAGCARWSEATRYTYRIDGNELMLLVPGITSRQEADLCGGNVDLALVGDEREVVFCARFGASLPWSHSAPFLWREVPEARRGVPPSPESNPGLRAQLRVTLVDADSGLVQAQRTVSLPPPFTSAPNGAIRAQVGLPAEAGHAEGSIARIRRLTPVGLPEPASRRPGSPPPRERR